MTNACLLNFTEPDRIGHYRFQGEWVKQIEIDFGSETIFEWKSALAIKRHNIQKKKESKLVWIVLEEVEYKNDDNLNGSDMTFNSENEAIQHFIDRVDELKWLAEKTKNNIVFDGRRYFLRINEKNEVVGRE